MEELREDPKKGNGQHLSRAGRTPLVPQDDVVKER